MNIRSILVSVVLVMISFSNLMKDEIYAQGTQAEIKVSLLIYFGRPNPQWIISGENQISNLRELIRGLPSQDPIDESQFVGGFLLVADEDKCRFPERLLVKDGKIKVTTLDGTVRFFEDIKGLEELLREQALQEGFGELLQ